MNISSFTRSIVLSVSFPMNLRWIVGRKQGQGCPNLFYDMDPVLPYVECVPDPANMSHRDIILILAKVVAVYHATIVGNILGYLK